MLKDIQIRNKESFDKLALVEEKMKRINVEVEELKAQRAEKAVRLESALVEFKPLKREIYESQCEVASLKKKVETSKNSQELKDANQFYETELKHYVEEANWANASAQKESEKEMKDYIANFHLKKSTNIPVPIGEGLSTWGSG